MMHICFDIDGTLLHTGGAGKRSMLEAFNALFGHSLEHIEMAGRTDAAIVQSGLEAAGLEATASRMLQFRQAYAELLSQSFSGPLPGARLCPGIPEILEELAVHPQFKLGLLTGNWEVTARMKLQHFGLNHYFNMGAFADDHTDRNRLLPAYIQKVTAAGQPAPIPQEVVIIGDTPRDVEAARVHGAHSMAVASGFASAESLLESQPSCFFESLEDVDAVLAQLLQLAQQLP